MSVGAGDDAEEGAGQWGGQWGWGRLLRERVIRAHQRAVGEDGEGRGGRQQGQEALQHRNGLQRGRGHEAAGEAATRGPRLQPSGGRLPRRSPPLRGATRGTHFSQAALVHLHNVGHARIQRSNLTTDSSQIFAMRANAPIRTHIYRKPQLVGPRMQHIRTFAMVPL